MLLIIRVFVNRSLSGPSPRTNLPWETLPGAKLPPTAQLLGSLGHSNSSTTLRFQFKEEFFFIIVFYLNSNLWAI